AALTARLTAAGAVAGAAAAVAAVRRAVPAATVRKRAQRGLLVDGRRWCGGVDSGGLKSREQVSRGDPLLSCDVVDALLAHSVSKCTFSGEIGRSSCVSSTRTARRNARLNPPRARACSKHSRVGWVYAPRPGRRAVRSATRTS